MNRTCKRVFFCGLSLTLLATFGFSDCSDIGVDPTTLPDETTPPTEMGAPPQEAFDACVDMAEGDSCSVDTPDGLLDGTCVLVENDQLACKPDDAPSDTSGQDTGGQDVGGDSGMPPEPPVEAIEACQGSADGDTCSFTGMNGLVEGTCLVLDDQLACVPENAPQ